MDLELAGKHVLVTGGSKGIGLACAAAFLREGAHVSIVSRSDANLEAARSALANVVGGGGQKRLHCIAADLVNAADALRAVDDAESALGPVHVLVNSAGAAKRTVPEDLSPQAWHDAMDAKYFTYIHSMDPVVKRMGVRREGAIVNVVGAGGKTPSTYHLPGGAANAALMLVTAGLAAAYGPQGVRVNAVNPGATTTERLQSGLEVSARQAGITREQALERAVRDVPLGRLAKPEEVADAVLFLASARASYVTGVVLTMDGAARPMVA